MQVDNLMMELREVKGDKENSKYRINLIDNYFSKGDVPLNKQPSQSNGSMAGGLIKRESSMAVKKDGSVLKKGTFQSVFNLFLVDFVHESEVIEDDQDDDGDKRI